ncbi:MAG TPA: hypothetical protein VMZ52_18310 [Bryobacteraceae bacterium]|nr:hypothetical protein [Bryobacteraceae bacterium]
MKPVVTFALGAVLASGVVYYAVHRDTPAPAPVIPQVETITSAPVETTPPVAVEPQPTGFATAPPIPAPVKPSPTGRPVAVKKPEHREIAQSKPAQTPASTQVTTPQPSTQTASQPSAAAPAPAAQPSSGSTNGQFTGFPGPPPEEHRAPEPRKPQTATLPAGTLLTVRVEESLSSEKNQPGDVFRASLDTPLVVDGMVIAERGSRVEGRIVEADRGGRVQGISRIALALTSFTTADGQKIKVQTETFAREGEKSMKEDVAKVGAAAAIGAAIGAIAGGGKGAAIGAGVGGAAGTGGVMATRGKAAQIPVETRMSFRLRDSVNITEKLR